MNKMIKKMMVAQTVIIEKHHENPIAVLGCALLGSIIGAIAG